MFEGVKPRGFVLVQVGPASVPPELDAVVLLLLLVLAPLVDEDDDEVEDEDDVDGDEEEDDEALPPVPTLPWVLPQPDASGMHGNTHEDRSAKP
jgi:hypothetical protein